MGVTFIGHASFFVQIGGLNVLIDPNFARWLFLLSASGSRDFASWICLRLICAGDPRHFDHLHRPSLRAIARRTEQLRGKLRSWSFRNMFHDLVSDLGYSRLVELDWWGSYQQGDLQVTHVPSRHWGAVF